MEEQLAMKKRGSKEETYLMHTCVGGGAATWMERNIKEKENNQNGRVT
jgi:hypothetical protein